MKNDLIGPVVFEWDATLLVQSNYLSPTTGTLAFTSPNSPSPEHIFTTHIGLERPQYNGARLIFSCRWASSPTVSLSVVTTANHTATSAVYSCSSVKYASLLGSRCIPPPRNLSRSNLVHENVESASLRWSGSAADAWFGGKESWKPLYKFMQKIAKIYVTSSSRIHRIRRNLSERL